MLLTVKAPSGTVTMAGWGLCPSRSSVLSTMSEIGSIRFSRGRLSGPVNSVFGGEGLRKTCRWHTGCSSIDRRPSWAGRCPEQRRPLDVFPPLRLREALNLGGLTFRELAVRTWREINRNEIQTRAAAV